jgi:hypothetical protein
MKNICLKQEKKVKSSAFFVTQVSHIAIFWENISYVHFTQLSNISDVIKLQQF